MTGLVGLLLVRGRATLLSVLLLLLLGGRVLLLIALLVGVTLEGGLGRGAVLVLGGVRQLLRVLLLARRQVETLTGSLLVLVHVEK